MVLPLRQNRSVIGESELRLIDGTVMEVFRLAGVVVDAGRRADVAGSKNRAATKMARKRLSQAGEFLKKDLYTAFYEELHKALLGFVSDKLNLPATELSKENIGEKLVEGGATQEQAERFIALLDAGLESAELYYNIGNACFKEGDMAHAILWYERALRVDPSHADARFNLEFACSQVQDRIDEVPEFFLKTWGRKLCWLLPSGVWAVLCIVFFAAMLALLLLFLLGSGGARKAGFFGGLVTLLLTLLCLGFAFWQRSDALKHDSAVVVSAVTEVKSSPGSGVSLFVLHEGTKVKLLERVGDWENIELSDGRQGWLKTTALEAI